MTRKTTILLTILLAVGNISFVAYVWGQSCPEGNTVLQRAHFAQTLTASQKVAIWEDHLNDYEGSHPNLSLDQSDVIQMGRDILTSQNFYANAGSENYAQSQLATQMNVLKIAAKAVFTDEEIFEIFEHLPDYTDEIEDPLAQRPFCNCVQWWGCSGENSGLNCSSGCGACSCNQILDCGPFWAFVCNGKCTGQVD